jgi:hypothetical protein
MHAITRLPDQRPGMNNSIGEKPEMLLIGALAGDSTIGSFLTWRESKPPATSMFDVGRFLFEFLRQRTRSAVQACR